MHHESEIGSRQSEHFTRIEHDVAVRGVIATMSQEGEGTAQQFLEIVLKLQSPRRQKPLLKLILPFTDNAAPPLRAGDAIAAKGDLTLVTTRTGGALNLVSSSLHTANVQLLKPVQGRP